MSPSWRSGLMSSITRVVSFRAARERGRAVLLDLQSCRAYDLAKLLDLFLEIGAQFLWTAGACDSANTDQLLAYVRGLQSLQYLGIQPSYDFHGRRGRNKQRVPEDHLVVGQSGFSDCWNVGSDGRSRPGR